MCNFAWWNFQCCNAQYLLKERGRAAAAGSRPRGFLPGGHNMRYRYAFFGQSGRVAGRAPWRLDTRHGSCVDGLVLAVDSCIPGRSQYKRTNTVRQIIEMKGIT